MHFPASQQVIDQLFFSLKKTRKQNPHANYDHDNSPEDVIFSFFRVLIGHLFQKPIREGMSFIHPPNKKCDSQNEKEKP